MEIKHGKKLDSYKIKKDLNKIDSIEKSKKASTSILAGHDIKNCPICFEEDKKLLGTIYNFTYYECLNCGVAYVLNQPIDTEIEKIYNSDFYTGMNKILLANDNIIDFRVKNIAEPKFNYIKKNITNDKNSWLDIGCGVGEVIYVASNNGFKTFGIETNENEREYGINKFGLSITNEYINEKTIDKYLKNYGIISLFSVLEHIKNPHSIIKNISSIQEKNDNLIIEVPHFPSISAYSQLTFPDHVNRMMHPPLHLFLFSLKAIEMLLKSYSYEISNVWFFGQDFYEFFSTVSIFANMNESILYEKLHPLFDDFQEVIDKKELSDEMLIIARKIK